MICRQIDRFRTKWRQQTGTIRTRDSPADSDPNHRIHIQDETMSSAVLQKEPIATEAQSDEDLLLRYRDTGDQAAIEELIRRYKRELNGYLVRYLADTSLADEAFQELWLRVHQKSHQFQEDRMESTTTSTSRPLSANRLARSTTSRESRTWLSTLRSRLPGKYFSARERSLDLCYLLHRIGAIAAFSPAPVMLCFTESTVRTGAHTFS
jgi:Sigma-70 region 2